MQAISIQTNPISIESDLLVYCFFFFVTVARLEKMYFAKKDENERISLCLICVILSFWNFFSHHLNERNNLLKSEKKCIFC